MTAVVQMVEAAARLPRYRETVLAWAPLIARFDPGPRGAFMGYDFHFGAGGPKLIEINTNAGGAFLNALLASAQLACCREVEQALSLPVETNFDDEVIRMFDAEWSVQPEARSSADRDRRRRAAEPVSLSRIPVGAAIFERHGIDAVWPTEAAYFRQGRLWADEEPLDLVYNRLVDFSLERPDHGRCGRRISQAPSW